MGRWTVTVKLWAQTPLFIADLEFLVPLSAAETWIQSTSASLAKGDEYIAQ
jgi:hypothetical protein